MKDAVMPVRISVTKERSAGTQGHSLSIAISAVPASR